MACVNESQEAKYLGKTVLFGYVCFFFVVMLHVRVWICNASVVVQLNNKKMG